MNYKKALEAIEEFMAASDDKNLEEYKRASEALDYLHSLSPPPEEEDRYSAPPPVYDKTTDMDYDPSTKTITIQDNPLAEQGNRPTPSGKAAGC